MQQDVVAEPIGPVGILAAMRDRTHRLHTEAERSGIVRDVLRGTASKDGYALLLRNLHPVYQALEDGLERHKRTELLCGLARSELYRSAAIEADLDAIAGPGWPALLPLLDAARCYAARVAVAGEGDGALLLAHAYTRFLGDLSGGRVMAARLAASLPELPAVLSFHAFPGITDVERFKVDYRLAFEVAGSRIPAVERVVEEAAEAFSLNIALSNEVQEVARTWQGRASSSVERSFA
jgi:heme oxygenase